MKKLIFTALFFCFTTPVHAESSMEFAEKLQDLSDRVFEESKVPLPAVPNAQSGDWFNLYVNNQFTGKPRILLSSITQAPDGSVRYVFNNRSAGGSDNITAEGIYCVTGTKLLDSEGSRIKTFGYADTVNNRWIEPRNAQWQMLGGKNNSRDKIRRVLYNAFCTHGFLSRTDDDLRTWVKQEGAAFDKNDYSK
ncbi:CNP1-like family protein [Kingella negevensis]|uniref:CNP1-like family protein n=1 Tax=Kingella negevensis TaxID=1522312 RepID=UPI00254E0F83|nr:CNP1-like family protein [Kingella negevensis]MDK4680075.1 CNP1-like family protein [Kingella negevensis]MDK4682205.1 CNP1-like family protein [Kingella negevensis]MDK4684384.1 CNP1-like family protein [Kingella negevensis]MDK4690402.1 CNP1-like family protein [Kingella negevensis]MDK4692249.1 CNP1-like family protein [Kingella negevensis]